ncbi:PIN domain-containing protein [Thiohalocapsa halophila]|uniref:Ribonuclease VapC n=1 Tax=Thiohalocapsa halophila TaxID=69359 RepID=A0ABS1CJA2_9GAMM|nr:type II toxin-antitoxin system VapC family toxin [Thiohalocapsa halophila]MBK1631995.1 PIN domain-containing protein [Thiohalocapsa halophila]
MIAVDTNVLVRILADDPEQPGQVAAARSLASEARQVFVPTVVQVETVWVLESGYRLSKQTIVEALDHLALNQAFVQEDADGCQRALDLFRGANADYADCLILAGCRARDVPLHTFDKRLSKLRGAALVTPDVA